MNCLNHPEISAVAYCRTCGKPLCEECKCASQGVIYCAEHVPAPAYVPPAPAAAPRPRTVSEEASPGLALASGFIPGVGAIYNAQYAKGLVHAVVFGLLLSIIRSEATVGLESLLYVLIWAWEFYMALEAYHTARKRRAGEPVDEFSSLLNLRGRGSFPAGAIVLIVLGTVLLMDTLGLFQFREIARFWPVALILLGLYMLYIRVAPQHSGEERGRCAMNVELLRAVRAPVTLIAVGTLFAIDHFTAYSFRQTWPALLILFGLLTLLGRELRPPYVPPPPGPPGSGPAR